MKECEKTLEQHDHQRALQVQTLADFRGELESLMSEYPDPASKWAITLIYPTLDHYETFAQNFVKMMAEAVDVAMMWGLLFLVFKVRPRKRPKYVKICSSHVACPRRKGGRGEPSKGHNEVAGEDRSQTSSFERGLAKYHRLHQSKVRCNGGQPRARDSLVEHHHDLPQSRSRTRR